MNSYSSSKQRALFALRIPRLGPLNRGALRALIFVCALLVLSNALFWAVDQWTEADVLMPLAKRSVDVSRAVSLNEDLALLSTLDNRVLLSDGERALREARFDSLIGGLAVDHIESQIYVGTALGEVHLLDEQLATLRSVAVEGRVVGVATAERGGVFVAHGIGGFSDRYFVSYFDSTASEATFTQQVEFTISAFDASAAGVVYGTANARVGLFDADGSAVWKMQLLHPPTTVHIVEPTGEVLFGDERGGLTLIDASGNARWAINISPYPLRTIASSNGRFWVGDEHGSLFAVDRDAQLLFSQRATESSVESILTSSAGIEAVVPRNGEWLAVNASAIRGARIVEQLRYLWWGTNGALLLALLLSLLFAVERWRRASVRQLRFAWRQRSAYLFILPAMVLILIFSYYPAVLAFYYSFTNFSTRSITQFIGLENYRQILFDDFYFRVGFVNLLLIVIANVIKTITVPLIAAELIFRLRNTLHQYVFRTLFILPAIVPGLIAVFLWRMVYDPYSGLLNQLLEAVGLSNWTRAWLADDSTALWAIIGAGFPYISAFPFLIFLGGLLNISTDMYDAAKIDGAGWWHQLWRIDVPLLSPQFRLLLFFAFASAIQGFAQVFIYTRGGPGYATYVPGLQMYYQIAEGDFGYASAIGVILFALIFLGTLFILRFRRQVEF